MLLIRLLAPDPAAEEWLRPIAARHAGGLERIEPGFWRLKEVPCDREALLRDLLEPVRSRGAVPALFEEGFSPQAAAFDLDSTLIPCEFVDRLAERRGLGARMRQLTAEAMEGRTDFRASYTQRLAMLEGMPLAEVDEEINALPLTPGAEELFRTLNRRNIPTAILTGGYRRAGEAVRRRLGIGLLRATDLEERGGRLTGRILPPLLDERGKAQALEAFCRENGKSPRQALAVGDGANDLAMLAEAGCAVLYNACPAPPAAGAPLDLLLSLFRPDDPKRPGEKPLLP